VTGAAMNSTRHSPPEQREGGFVARAEATASAGGDAEKPDQPKIHDSNGCGEIASAARTARSLSDPYGLSNNLAHAGRLDPPFFHQRISIDLPSTVMRSARISSLSTLEG
jgi:hypothetical protein